MSGQGLCGADCRLLLKNKAQPALSQSTGVYEPPHGQALLLQQLGGHTYLSLIPNLCSAKGQIETQLYPDRETTAPETSVTSLLLPE